MEELVKHFLSEGILDYFEVVKIESNDQLTIHLEEKNIPPKLNHDSKIVSKGFYDSITIQDFLIRKKACYLIFKRRKWLDELTGNIINNNWKLAAKGTRMTKELASFLKGNN